MLPRRNSDTEEEHTNEEALSRSALLKGDSTTKRASWVCTAGADLND